MKMAPGACIARFYSDYQRYAREKNDDELTDHIRTNEYFTHPELHQGWAERLYRRAHLIEAVNRGIKV